MIIPTYIGIKIIYNVLFSVFIPISIIINYEHYHNIIIWCFISMSTTMFTIMTTLYLGCFVNINNYKLSLSNKTITNRPIYILSILSIYFSQYIAILIYSGCIVTNILNDVNIVGLFIIIKMVTNSAEFIIEGIIIISKIYKLKKEKQPIEIVLFMTPKISSDVSSDVSSNISSNVNKWTMIECVICLNEYKEKEYVLRAKCGHIYHIECCKKMIDNKIYKCPLCKEKIIII